MPAALSAPPVGRRRSSSRSTSRPTSAHNRSDSSRKPAHRMKAHPRSVRGEHAIQHERVKMRVEQAARPMRQAQDPLSDRRVGEDLIDEMRGQNRRPYTRRPRAELSAGDTPKAGKTTAREPHRRKSRTSWSTNLESPSPPRSDTACGRKVSK